MTFRYLEDGQQPTALVFNAEPSGCRRLMFMLAIPVVFGMGFMFANSVHPAPPLASSTPTRTLTSTATPTGTRTPTVTFTPTATPSNTPTPTATKEPLISQAPNVNVIVVTVAPAVTATPFQVQIGATATPAAELPTATGTQVTASSCSYRMKPGEYLSMVANRYGVSIDFLVKANTWIRNPDYIWVNALIIIPGCTP